MKTPQPTLSILILILVLIGCSKENDVFVEALEQNIEENIEKDKESNDENDDPIVDDTVSDNLKAFPTAEGFGKFATGGRGGEVYKVTNLNDSGPGSLRDAVSQGNRIILFTQGGNISLSSPLYITNDNITIAGQSAPGGGIALNINGQDLPVMEISANNVVIRYLRVRHSLEYVGSSSGADGIHIAGGENIIIDHCSVTWASDENIAITQYTNRLTRNVTIQNCIIGEGFTGSSKGALITGDLDFITFYRNFFTMNEIRSPQIASDWDYPNSDRYSEVINNVVYDYKEATRIRNNQGSGRYLVNVVSNFYEQPSGVTSSRRAVPIYDHYDWVNAGNEAEEIEVYVENNIDSFRSSDGQDEWDITQGEDGTQNRNVLGDKATQQSSAPYTSWILDNQSLVVDAFSVWDNINQNVGASLPQRDTADLTLIDDYNSGYNRDSSYTTHEFPVLSNGTAPEDTDNDGMPDDWENANGFDPSSQDGHLDADGDGYTNIEEYLNLIAS